MDFNNANLVLTPVRPLERQFTVLYFPSEQWKLIRSKFSRFLFNTTAGDQLSIGYRDSVDKLICIPTDPSNLDARESVPAAG